MFNIAEAAREIGIISQESIPVYRIDNRALLCGIARGFAPYDAMFATLNNSIKYRICEMSDLQKYGSSSSSLPSS